MSRPTSKKFSHIVFDWNGTLLDDIKLAVDSVNTILNKYSLPSITREIYRDLFHFPIKSFYAKLGFSFNYVSFEQLAQEYLEQFDGRFASCELQTGAISLLRQLKDMDYKMSILSACYQNTLRSSLEYHKLNEYFNCIYGLRDLHAFSKLEMSIRLQEELNLNPNKILYVGDTNHDGEIARELNWKCILIPNGHQSKRQLNVLDCVVIEKIIDVLSYL
jgi:phosphoglycolate phosphatase